MRYETGHRKYGSVADARSPPVNGYNARGKALDVTTDERLSNRWTVLKNDAETPLVSPNTTLSHGCLCESVAMRLLK